MAKKSKLAIADALLAVYRRLSGRARRAPRSLAQTDFRSITVYSTTALGDLMFNTPAIRQLRLRYPQAQIALVVHRKFASLVQDYSDIDRVVCWDGRFVTLFASLRVLRALHPDLAVILHSRTPYDVMSAVLSGAEHVLRDEPVAVEPVPMARWLSAWAQTGYSGHVIRRKLAMLSTALGCRDDDVAMHPLCPVDRSRFAEVGKIRVGFQLGASTPERRWPIERFVQLAEALCSAHGNCRIVLMGSGQEAPLAEQFMTGLSARHHDAVSVMTGRTTLRDAFDLVASLDVLVTGDTGPLHLAIALQVPTVSLFVSANPQATGPCQDPQLHTVIHRPLPADASASQIAQPMILIPVCDVAESLACLFTRMTSRSDPPKSIFDV